MTDPIYPDKEKTGLAALKPLTDAFFAEPERWVWEGLVNETWTTYSVDGVLHAYQQSNRQVRLTPKPRRVWIGDESYEAHEFNDLDSEIGCWLVDLTQDIITGCVDDYPDYVLQSAARNYLLFRNQRGARQCLDAYRKARRVE